MTINTNSLNTRITSDSAGNLTELELLQLSAAASTLENNKVYSVAELTDLPAAADNIGRFVFVDSIQTYRYSNGESWIRDYDSNIEYSAGISNSWTWGHNNYGQLGDNTAVSKRSPVSVVGGFTDWCQISAGECNTMAVRTNGTLWAWGRSSCGELGNGNTISRSSPVSVVGGFTDWCQVSAGGRHTAAMRTNGTLWAWGHNNNGQLGDTTLVAKSSPICVVGGFADWCQVSAGGYHNAAIRTNGTIWAWGAGASGRLGDNTILNKLSPVSVVGGFTDWCQVSAGSNHSAAIRTNGSLWAWGFNSAGQLGQLNTISRSSPVQVVGSAGWCQVSAGQSQTAAVKTDGTLWAWGANNFGKLGDNTTVFKCSPVQVVGGFTDWCQVSSGYHTAAVRTNGTVWAWGYNNFGQLGDNTTAAKSSPVSVVSSLSYWFQVSSGNRHTAALALDFKSGF